MKSTMNHSFGITPSVDIQRSVFDRSHGHKTTFDAGKLVPIYCDEALPGDTFKMDASIFARMTTPIFPIMDNIFMDIHFFSVPMRQLWENFRPFMGENISGSGPVGLTDYVMPIQSITSLNEGTLEDYLGMPIGKAIDYNALYRRAYIHIVNEWYRDQNSLGNYPMYTGDGPDTDQALGYPLANRHKRLDYFTSCTPWPQKGNPSYIPLGTEAPVIGIGKFDQTYTGTSGLAYESDAGTDTYPSYSFVAGTGSNTSFIVEEDPDNTGYPNIRVDLTQAAAATINDLRAAFAIQKFLERDSRNGTRYSELVKSHFGVTFMDVTYRPEFLGGGTVPVNINPVPQQSSTDATTPQGNLAAFATAGGSNIGFVKSFTEHCIVYGIISVRADLTYQQGLNRMFTRSSRLDYYWPEFAHLGEQTVHLGEIYHQGTSSDDNVFGYQERYAEYRYKPSIVTGKMRSAATDSLDAWHLAQEFITQPALNAAFTWEDPPMDRILAVSNQPHFIFDSYFRLKCIRPMPMFGTPGLVDHF